MQLSIGEIAGAWPQSLVARNVVVSDNEGPWLTISAVEIGWRPWRLLDRTIDVERIELSEIALARLPAGPPEAESDEGGGELGALLRSEEHTSELQSLMRSSYAVFCLKKKKQQE